MRMTRRNQLLVTEEMLAIELAMLEHGASKIQGCFVSTLHLTAVASRVTCGETLGVVESWQPCENAESDGMLWQGGARLLPTKDFAESMCRVVGGWFCLKPLCLGTSQPLVEDLLEAEQDSGDQKLEVITLSRTFAALAIS